LQDLICVHARATRAILIAAAFFVGAAAIAIFPVVCLQVIRYYNLPFQFVQVQRVEIVVGQLFGVLFNDSAKDIKCSLANAEAGIKESCKKKIKMV